MENSLKKHAGEFAKVIAGINGTLDVVVDKLEWPVINLRVDWSDTPIEDLYQLWKVYEPQVEDYIVRALNPTDSPSYGVPGNE